MKIGDMLDKETKKKLKRRYGETSHKEKLSERDIEELMGARSYYRGKGGAIKQR